jgi:hypothetical protein
MKVFAAILSDGLGAGTQSTGSRMQKTNEGERRAGDSTSAKR